MQYRQSGMSLLEILAAIAVGTVLFIGLVEMIDISMEDARGQQAAHHQSQVVNAAQKHIAANYVDLKNGTVFGAVKAVTVADLKAGGFLPSSFADTNSYQQNTCVLIRQAPGAGGEILLNALVVSYSGLAIPDRSIAAAAMGAGQGAGYIASTDFTHARGPSWSLDTTLYRPGTCLGGAKPLNGDGTDAGHLVSNIFSDGPGQIRADFLYRDTVPGRPDLNRMNVPLQMASLALVPLGAVCPDTALALESTTKDVVVCDGGTWRYSNSSWKAPVADYGALAAVAKTDGDVRVTRDTRRAFVYDGGTNTWTALAVDQNGDLSVPRDLQVDGNIAAEGGLHTKGHIFTDADINVAKNAIITGRVDVTGDVNMAKNVDIGQTLTARGDIAAKQNMDIDGYFRGKGEVRGQWMAANAYVADGRTSPGAPCNYLIGGTVYNPVGTIIPDATGILLTCSSIDNTFRYSNGQHTP
jgi:cytoskeletal protein CcmA (bactofilin family)/type II secretory pathway pseudopilin PulG